VERSIADLPGVSGVHDLHIWTISSGRIALSGHVVAEDTHDHAKLLQEVSDLLYERFDISHNTIQIETPGFDRPGGGVCFD
jgi:cobalt-zinc-cadmium efflux system protein